MNKCHTKTVWGGVVALSLFLFFTGCETVTDDFFVDEDGKEIENIEINLQNTLLDLGVKAYTIDSIYTEFVFTEGKNPRIKYFKKGIAKFETNGKLKSVTMSQSKATFNIGSDVSYEYKGIRSKITQRENGFIDVVENYKDSRLVSNLKYTYKSNGFLDYVTLERSGEKPVTIVFRYPDADGGLTIQEGAKFYKIPLAKDPVTKEKLENKGYICNVFNHVNAPLTNEYVIIPDLYYLGLYGVPLKYLPDTFIEKGVITEDGVKNSVISRVGTHRFYYKN